MSASRRRLIPARSGKPVRGHYLTLLAVLAATVPAALSVAVVASPASAATVSLPLRTMVANLPVAAEVRTGYDRDLFNHWIDADGDGCNTRYEVLIAEAVTAPTVGSSCGLTGGRWFSYYDGLSWTAPADLDIDHFVPLAEAWDSGARTWTAARRESFANDLGDARSLVAVTDNENQSKSDQDPAEWMPPLAAVRCRYLEEWAAVKTRWGLTVDSTEKSALTTSAASCANATITVVTAPGGTATATATASPATCAGTNGTDVPIPDAGTAVTSTITIAGCARPASATATVSVSVVHAFRGDVVVTLVAPDGSTYALKGSSSSDGAANVQATYPVDLSAEAAAGSWSLRLQDVYEEDSGHLDTWTLTA